MEFFHTFVSLKNIQRWSHGSQNDNLQEPTGISASKLTFSVVSIMLLISFDAKISVYIIFAFKAWNWNVWCCSAKQKLWKKSTVFLCVSSLSCLFSLEQQNLLSEGNICLVAKGNCQSSSHIVGFLYDLQQHCAENPRFDYRICIINIFQPSHLTSW